jgi:hypothetical protein
MGQTIQQRQLKVFEDARAADAVKVSVTLTRAQANAILGRFIDARGNVTGMTWAEERAGHLDAVLQSALDEVRYGLYCSSPYNNTAKHPDNMRRLFDDGRG